MDLCCLCRETLPANRRKKKLHGAGCVVAKSVLAALSSAPLDCFETLHAAAWLCVHCELALDAIRRFENQIIALKADISTKLSSLPLRSEIVSTSTAKRPRPVPDTEPTDVRLVIS